MFEILSKYAILNKFGGNYTWSNLDQESFMNIQLIQICMAAEDAYMKLQEKGANYVG